MSGKPGVKATALVRPYCCVLTRAQVARMKAAIASGVIHEDLMDRFACGNEVIHMVIDGRYIAAEDREHDPYAPCDRARRLEQSPLPEYEKVESNGKWRERYNSRSKRR